MLLSAFEFVLAERQYNSSVTLDLGKCLREWG